jgi:hypothetical protein
MYKTREAILMSDHHSAPARRCDLAGRDALAASPTVAHWLAALESGRDIGHFGRLAFAIVARYFLAADQLVALLASQPKYDGPRARQLLLRVRERGYAPPSRPRLIEWQARQTFPLLPSCEDPTVGNLYRELPLPDSVFGQIEEFWEGAP